MKKVIIPCKIPNIAKEILSKKFSLVEKKLISRNDLIEAVKNYDAILSLVSYPFTKDILSNSVKLKVLSNYGVGFDNIDVKYADKRNIKVFNLPDIVTNSTADLAFALFLSFIRKIKESHLYVKKGKWKTHNMDLFLGEELFDKTLGIIGFGRIGKALAKRAFGFGLNVIFHKRSKENFKTAKQVSKEELLKSSDYIMLALPLTKETESFIKAEDFKKMEKKPLIINISRGKVINTKDLIYSLKKGLIKGAALDVTDPEPLKKHPLRKLKNCIITSHIGTSTFCCRYQMAKKAAENILNNL